MRVVGRPACLINKDNKTHTHLVGGPNNPYRNRIPNPNLSGMVWWCDSPVVGGGPASQLLSIYGKTVGLLFTIVGAASRPKWNICFETMGGVQSFTYKKPKKILK